MVFRRSQSAIDTIIRPFYVHFEKCGFACELGVVLSLRGEFTVQPVAIINAKSCCDQTSETAPQHRPLLGIAGRRREPELMDAPDLDRELHVAALAGLRRINSLTRSASILWPAIARAAAAIEQKPLRVLDLACGSGDNALAIARIARRRNIEVEVHGCDVSLVAIAEAELHATEQRIQTTRFFSCNVLQDPLPPGYHVVMCSLFLHHLAREQAVELIRHMAAASRHAVLVSDLRRTWTGFGLAWLGSRLFTRSPIVHTDALLSVVGAFVECEVESMLAECALQRTTAKITRHWPQRWLLELIKL